MIVGCVFAPGAGPATLQATGQWSRTQKHVAAYVERGHEVTYCPLPTGMRRAIAHALVRSLGVDVIRATSLRAGIPAAFARLARGVPFVVSHGARYEEISRIHGQPAWKWRLVRAFVFRLASAVIAPNPLHAEQLAKAYPKARIEAIPNWVDLDLFQPRAPEVTFPTVLYVGRLVKEKNLERLARVCKRYDADLVCVGAGPLRDTLVSLGAKCPGAVEWDQLPRFYQNAHVFCLPSLTEGHPKALLEALASGLPCVTSDVVEGIDAPMLRFRPDDEAEMARAILRALGDKTLRGWLSDSGRTAAKAWDYRAVMEREVRLVESCAS